VYINYLTILVLPLLQQPISPFLFYQVTSMFETLVKLINAHPF